MYKHIYFVMDAQGNGDKSIVVIYDMSCDVSAVAAKHFNRVNVNWLCLDSTEATGFNVLA